MPSSSANTPITRNQVDDLILASCYAGVGGIFTGLMLDLVSVMLAGMLDYYVSPSSVYGTIATSIILISGILLSFGVLAKVATTVYDNCFSSSTPSNA